MSQRLDPKLIEVYGRLWRYVTPYRYIGIVAILGMATAAIVEGLLVWMLEPMTDEALVAHNLETAKWMPLAFVAIFIIRGIAGFATEASLGWIGRAVISSLRRDVFSKFLTLPSRFIEQQSTGPLLSRMTYNVEMVSESVTNVVTMMVRDVLTILAAAAVMLYQSPRLSAFVAIVLPVIAVMIRLLAKAFRRYSSRIQDSVGEVTQVTEEVLSGHRVVKIFGGREYETERMFEADGRNRRQHLKMIRTKALGTALTQIIFGFGVALVIYFASVEALKGNFSAGQFISFFSAMMLMLQPLRRITNLNAVLQRGIAAGDSLFRIIDEPDEVDSGTVSRDEVRGAVEFRNVSFSYGRQEAQVIDDLSLTIDAGKTLAIVGHSGSGKSTLVGLLPRFYDVDSGEILLDGVPIQEYALTNLRENISLVSQDVVLFNDTIANNIAYGSLRKYSRAELLEAAEAAHILEFVNDMPDGLETVVGDRGVLLSGGQRQRIAIGRALLKDAPVLILDEATSSLDTKSERRIQDALSTLMKDRTTLVIAHRLSTVENADQIIVLDQGRIVESGTHSELLALNGQYSSLYKMQFNDEPENGNP
ncbi:MAG: lipid A export permease/ATP-binding protein MsbA [Gammaproteobacteria bacterium]|nr:lipid A export permease/ATP-binding protein MsbA [Gammaproteobacteria bacterium]MDH4313504.1 lipid A export permease/ATP-binding protein MsbA [Gammaproteobacteria bacterium]MDH5213884.1 lipid A export permease/ATP-binding protein MsbA [Gammaproteobacteria bacterium]